MMKQTSVFNLSALVIICIFSVIRSTWASTIQIHTLDNSAFEAISATQRKPDASPLKTDQGSDNGLEKAGETSVRHQEARGFGGGKSSTGGRGTLHRAKPNPILKGSPKDGFGAASTSTQPAGINQGSESFANTAGELLGGGSQRPNLGATGKSLVQETAGDTSFSGRRFLAGNRGSSSSPQFAQSSPVLLQNQIANGLALNGQQKPAQDQVASLTSRNNFINFCATRPDLSLTNGQQVRRGSCNAVPMGMIASTARMPMSKFVFPRNLDTIPAGQTFTIRMKINNVATGNFVNPQANYFGAPQTTDATGRIIGHSHVVVQKIDSLTSTDLVDPSQFDFFKGMNTEAVNGELTALVTGGLAPGVYKMSSVNSAANHQPVLVAVAQHGHLDDAVYFTVVNTFRGGGGRGGRGQ